MKHHRLCVAVILAILVILVSSAPGLTEDQSAEIKLVDPGASPRKELRYRLTPGSSDTMVFEGKMSIGFEMAGQNRPPMEMPLPSMTFVFSVKDVSPQGDAVVEMKVAKVGSMTMPGESQQAAEAARKANDSLQKLVGTTQRYAISPQGSVIDAETDQTLLDDPQMQQMFDRIRQAPTAPFPKDAVGEGARWEVTNAVTDSPMKMTQTVVYTLIELKGDKVKLRAVHRQDAPVQEMPSRPGAVVRLESFDSTGSSVIEAELTKVVPTSTQMALDMSMDMSVVVTQRMKAKTGMEFRMHSKGK